MQLVRLYAHSPSLSLPPLVMTIGNFDGVHVGHQALIQQLKRIANQQHLKTAVMIFEPQPLEFFLGHQAPPRISSLREKLTILNQFDVDYVILANFNDQFRQLTADQFAQLLKQSLNVNALILGDDFHFGKDRQGNRDFLEAQGFQVTSLETVHLAQERISSTRIRQVLQHGDFALAQQLLGRPYSITGRIVYGDQIGRTIQFPTANVALNRHQPCLHGIYAVNVAFHSPISQLNLSHGGIAGYTPNSLFGAGHVGTRPAIQQQYPEWRLEIHFPELSGNLYGQLVTVTFLHFLHGEQHYPSLEALKIGIDHDVQQLIAYREQQQTFPF